MKITRVESRDAQGHTSHDLGAGLVPLTAGFGPGPATHRAVLGLVGECLYGVPAGANDDGFVEVARGPEERYRLTRRAELGGRLTIASLDGSAPPADAFERLFESLPHRPLRAVLFAAGPGAHDPGRLLAPDVAELFRRLGGDQQAPAAGPHDPSLVARRDELAAQIERLLHDRRRESAALEARVASIDAELAALDADRQPMVADLRAARGELARLEATARTRSIAATVAQATDAEQGPDGQCRLDELETEIDRWRAALADLERRDSRVRSELAQVHPDDHSPRVAVADHRAAIAVAQRLLEDLAGESARLARATQTQACLCRDAHPRIQPLIDTLTEQLDRLSALTAQHEAALRVVDLRGEAEHLARSKADLQQQLEHLLARRQELWRATRSRARVGRVAPAYEPLDLSPADAAGVVEDAQRRLAALDARRDALTAERLRVEAQRSGLLGDGELEPLQAELRRLQTLLDRGGLSAITAAGPRGPRSDAWRASQVFARLTNGRFVGLTLAPGGRELIATAAHGEQAPVGRLPENLRALAAMSMRLSLAVAAHDAGVELPLVLDEPFAPWDDAEASLVADALADYARAGRQTLVRTERAAALRRFDAAGAYARAPRVGAWAEPEVAPPLPVTQARAAAPAPVETLPPLTRVRVATPHAEPSPYLLAPSDPLHRFPIAIADRDGLFASTRVETLGEFMSADPALLAERIDRAGVTPDLVALWQTHLAFVCFVPGMTLDDASVLTAAGLTGPEGLASIDPDELATRLRDYLRTDRGQRWGGRGLNVRPETSREWVSRAGEGLRRWGGDDAWARFARRRGERRDRVRGAATPRSGGEVLALRTKATRTHDTARNGAKRRHTEGAPRRERDGAKRRAESPRFFLEARSAVADAPSIGPKMADRLAGLGVRTVRDLLGVDPADLSLRLGSDRITDETVLAWQNQAKLVCRVPQLRGHDAQVLVACGFTTPEELATMAPGQLLEFVKPYCESEEGQRVLRGSKAPDLDEVTNWIAWSRQSRSLGAA